MSEMPSNTQAIRFRLLPPHFLVAALGLSWMLDRWLPLVQLWDRPAGAIGGAIVVAALAVNIYCALELRRRQTTIIPFRESSVLVTDGLYRYSRNPIYVSMVVLLVGVAIAWGSLSPWLLPPAFIAIITTRFIRPEEAMLTQTFGQEYRAYCRRVPRWLWRLRSPR